MSYVCLLLNLAVFNCLGKASKRPFSKHWTKCWRIFPWSKETSVTAEKDVWHSSVSCQPPMFGNCFFRSFCDSLMTLSSRRHLLSMYGNVFTEKPLLKTYFLNYYHFLQENSVRKLCMVMFLLSFVKGSKSAEGGPNPLADMDPGGPILGGSKSAGTPATTATDWSPFHLWVHHQQPRV